MTTTQEPQTAAVEPTRGTRFTGWAANYIDERTSISGAGPSVFAWCESEAQAREASMAMAAAFANAGFDSDVFVTPIASPAAQVLA